jgi:tRNA A-37 threonylcarbamoyl transferase component Bud32
MSRTTCLTSDELAAFHLGDLPETMLKELADHLEGCPHCEAAARALDGLSDPVMAAFRHSARAAPLSTGGRGVAGDAEVLPASIGNYDILAEIGRGGMGIVYKARHQTLHRVVALKMLLGGAFADRAERARFRTEAEAVARLQHSGIVQIYEIGEHDVGAGLPRPYFTLEYVAGGNLSVHVAGRPQSPRQAASWLEALARAAHYAHQRGIVHRDLKPSNVLLTPEGDPKICDFGVAKLLTGSDVKTMSGMLVGTAEYMAPEQASAGAAVGPAADTYALGAILYAVLTGRPPFQGTSVLHTLEQVRQQEPVPLRRLQPRVPADLETICLKCLEKDPGRRYASALDLAEDLRRFLADEPIQARRTPLPGRVARWVRRHKAVAAAVGTVAVSLVAATVVSVVAAVQEAGERNAALTAKDDAEAARRRAERDRQSEGQARKSAEEQRDLALRNLYAAKTNLTGMTLDVPDGMTQVARLLSEWRGQDAAEDPRGWEWYYCQSLLARAHRTLRGHTLDAASLAWSPDGKRLASGSFDHAIRIWDAATGKQLRKFAAPWGVLALDWSPDGRQLAAANWPDPPTVGIWDVAAGKMVRTLSGHRGDPWGVAWNRDGRRLASCDSTGKVIVWDVPAGKPLFILQGDADSGRAVSWSPDGRRLATVNFTSLDGAPWS